MVWCLNIILYSTWALKALSNTSLIHLITQTLKKCFYLHQNTLSNIYTDTLMDSSEGQRCKDSGAGRLIQRPSWQVDTSLSHLNHSQPLFSFEGSKLKRLPIRVKDSTDWHMRGVANIFKWTIQPGWFIGDQSSATKWWPIRLGTFHIWTNTKLKEQGHNWGDKGK